MGDFWLFSDSIAVVTSAPPAEIELGVRALLPEAAAPDDVADKEE